jgi:hypothetical protein
VFHHPNLPVDIESSVSISTSLYQDYSRVELKFGAFRTGSKWATVTCRRKTLAMFETR